MLVAEGDVREEDQADGCECGGNLNYGYRREAPPKQVSTENFHFGQLRESINYFRMYVWDNQASITNLKYCPLTWLWLLVTSSVLCKQSLF